MTWLFCPEQLREIYFSYQKLLVCDFLRPNNTFEKKLKINVNSWFDGEVTTTFRFMFYILGFMRQCKGHFTLSIYSL